ncbi:MAG: hypothetical protein JO157_03835 [Acetobacteraceae bacterium]|nr:hypothetical protein [Acetobacteraceae bacterium]
MADEASKAVLDAIAVLHADMHAGQAGIMDRIDRLQGTVEQLRADSMVNWSTTDTALRRVRTNQDEARETYDLIAAMQRQIRLLEARMDEIQGRDATTG